jgi:hypothetical protein
VSISELPVRLLGDCLRGSAALHSSLPHPPTLRAQAALAMAQWQNNKAPLTRDSIGDDEWIGLKLLLQYFSERFTTTDKAGNTMVMPCKYWRETVQRNEGGEFQYMDEIDKDEEEAIRIRTAAMAQLELSGEAVDDVYPKVEREEDEEYRVRSAVITAIASIRAKDGQTPPMVMDFLEQLLPVCDGAVFATCTEGGNLQRQYKGMVETAPLKVVGLALDEILAFRNVDDLEHIASVLVADTLLSLCYVNITPDKPRDLTDVIMNSPVVGMDVVGRQESMSKGLSSLPQPPKRHPAQTLIDMCQQWLDWALYQEATAREVEAETLTGVGEGSFSIIAPSAISALMSLALLKQSTTKEIKRSKTSSKGDKLAASAEEIEVQDVAPDYVDPQLEKAATANYYLGIMDAVPTRSDVTRAAAAQAIACVCCAADRRKSGGAEALGLLSALELLMTRVNGT